MQILIIAGYKFTPLENLASLRTHFHEACQRWALKGSILLSEEGININLAGPSTAINEFISFLQTDNRFAGISFHSSYSDTLPFQKLKIKLKKEIIRMRQPSANPLAFRAPSISAETFKEWLDTKKDITVLDTRNTYEVQEGTFMGAKQLHLDEFSEFPAAAVATLEKDKPIVMFCTGGIRCEKAALYLLEKGFSTVYQLDGGILGYFAKVGGVHFQGHCFVFDERLAIDTHLHPVS